MIVIGSHALRHRGVQVEEPIDLDLVGTFADVEYLSKGADVTYPMSESHYVIRRGKQIIEVDVAWGGGSTNDLLLGADYQMPDLLHVPEIRRYVHVPTLDMLYTLKMSHRFRGGKHFLKTMRHIHLMREAGALVRDTEFLKMREAETYGKHPKLNVSKDQFFDAAHGVEYVYDHDSIHQAVKHLWEPSYSYFKPPESEVMVSREMWDRLPRVAQLYAVLEECYVLALERSQVPHPHVAPERSFEIAIEKVCTQITSGWFREFAWENYDAVRSLYSGDYVRRFRDAVEAGVVKKL